MKRLITTVIVLIASITLVSAAVADDAADVKAAWLKVNAAMNSGDIDVIAQHTHPKGSLFNYSGRLLRESFNADGLKAAFDAGLKFNWGVRSLQATVYGNAAVVTGYHVGTITSENGDINRGTRRFSEFWIKQGGKWKQVHRHASQLEPVQRETIAAPTATNGQ